jgi:RNA polymerase sigma factor (sigma-70 family)
MSDTDLQLLARYTRQHAEDAFAELVRRHLDLVFSAALRQVRSPQLAEEVAQSAFTDLARQANRLASDTILTAWLYQVTRRTAIDVVRHEARRQHREQVACELNAMNTPAADWIHIEPLLDEAMHALEETDRTAVLLRYFENKSLREVGQTLGTNEDAARKRVSRAVERLRAFFAKRGVTIGASGLVVAISANAVQAAPVGLALTISTAAALVGSSIATTVSATATKALVMTTLHKTIIGATLAVAIGTGIHEARQASTLRSQNEALQQQQASLADQLLQAQREHDDAMKRLGILSAKLSLHLPAPPVQFTTPPKPPAEAGQSTNLLARFQGLKDKAPNRLAVAQLESYLNTHGRNAASLLAAYRTTGDQTLLAEAMQKNPNDPQVALDAAQRQDASVADRRQWLETFKHSAPDNALPNYLSALDYFKAGQTDQAVQELLAASGKQQFNDYSAHRVQDNEQAYLAAGYPVGEAKAMAPLQQAMYWASSEEAEGMFTSFQSQLTQLQQVKELSQNVVELAKSYTQAGDPASARAALQIVANLGQHYSNTSGEDGLSRGVGGAAEVMALYAMDLNSSYDGGGQTVQDRINQLREQRKAIRGLYAQAVPMLETLSDQDWIGYSDRARAFGEPAALQWVVGKFGQK